MRAGDDDFVRYPPGRRGLHGRDDRGDSTRSEAVGTACTKADDDDESIRDDEPIRNAEPRPSVTVVPGTTTFEIRWPPAVGYRGYVLLRRDPAGNVVTLDPLVRAFTYRDALATGAHGDFAYALRIVSVRGVGPAGPFAGAKDAP